MPCRDDRRPCSETLAKKRIDELTQNLCFSCGIIEERGLWKSIDNPRLQEWWANHQVDDSKRVTIKMITFAKKNPLVSDATIAEHFIEEAAKVHPVSRWHKAWFHKIATAIVLNQIAKWEREEKLKASILEKLNPVEKAFLKTNSIT